MRCEAAGRGRPVGVAVLGRESSVDRNPVTGSETPALYLSSLNGEQESSLDGIRPASPIEERFWLMHELHTSEAVCNEAIVLRLRGALRIDALAAALEAIVQAHPPLRTRYAQRGATLEAEPQPLERPILEC